MRIKLLVKPITLTVDIIPELREELINMASYKETTLTNYVIEAIEAQLNHDKGNQFAEKNLAQTSVSPEEALKVLQEFVDASD